MDYKIGSKAFALGTGHYLSPGGDHSIVGGTEGQRGGGPVINADPSRGDHSTCWKRFSVLSHSSFRGRGLPNDHYNQICMYILTHLLKFNSCFVQLVQTYNSHFNTTNGIHDLSSRISLY